MSAEDYSSHESGALSPSVETEPLSPSAEKAARITERIRHEFANSWREDGDFLGKLFPVCHSATIQLRETQERNYNSGSSRWKGIPRKPQTASKLYTPLRMLMNDILVAEERSRQHQSLQGKGIRGKRLQWRSVHVSEGSWHTKHVRRILATHPGTKRARNGPDPPLSPLLLAGAGTEVLAISWTVIQAKPLSGLSPIEVILDSDDFLSARDRLAVHMTQMISNQHHRRFAYGLIMTETTCTVYMFDHSGAVASRPFNYHEQPAQFCAVLFGLGSNQGDRIGFDSSIFADKRGYLVRTLTKAGKKSSKEVHYAIKEGLFRFSSLIGRGTICWRTVKLDDQRLRYVIKDAWIPHEELPGRESEASLLRHALASGVVSGVAQLEHSEEVQRSKNPNDLDTILRNRKVDKPTAEDMKLERVHTRIVLKTLGVPIDEFETRKDLLLAFHDAVQAHKQLHDVAGILHRDISTGNVLINPDGAEGNRGILVDFDHAIRVGDTSPYSKKKHIGTWRYMSYNVIDGKGDHTYLDDLQSFYYVLLWILMVYSGPHKVKAQLPDDACLWDLPGSFGAKRGHFAWEKFDLPVDPWFGPCLKVLASHLFHFFRVRRFDPAKPLSALDPRKDYDEYLGYIKHCIVDMEAEDLTAKQLQASDSEDLPSTQHLGKRHREEELNLDGTHVCSRSRKKYRGLFERPSNDEDYGVGF